MPFRYAESCNVDLPQFAPGRALESYVRERYPGVTAAGQGKFSPVFVHCQDSRVYTDDLTGSKRSPDQVKIAQDFAADLVTTKKLDAAQMVVLAPYSAKVKLISHMRKRPEYSALSVMKAGSTIDGYQGKEANIVIVVMCTAYPKPGPGSTCDEQRLNVMLTRQRSGLVIVGDIGKGKEKGRGQGEKFRVVGANGEMSFARGIGSPLQYLHRAAPGRPSYQNRYPSQASSSR